jgi:hypothetical protein
LAAAYSVRSKVDERVDCRYNGLAVRECANARAQYLAPQFFWAIVLFFGMELFVTAPNPLTKTLNQHMVDWALSLTKKV